MNERIQTELPARAPSGVQAFRATCVEDVSALLRMADEWDALVSRSPEPAPFQRARWLHAWWRSFGKGTPLVVTVRGPAGRLVGAALFSLRRARFHGVPVRLLTLASNAHSNRADLVVDAEYLEAAAATLARVVHDRRGDWTVCFLDHVPADSEAVAAFGAEMRRLGHVVGERRIETPPFIPLLDGYDAFLATLATKWKSNLRNREKRIGALGEIAHETVRGPLPDLDARLEECFALERKTWKGAAGSSILDRAPTHLFYVAIAKNAAEDGTLALQTLRVGGRLAAFQLDLVANRVEYVLKIGYEPELAALSPGALLMRRTIERAAAAGLALVDLLGDDMPWKRDWTSRVRPHVRFLAFGSGPTGRALSRLDLDLIPSFRAWRARSVPEVSP